MSPVALQSQQAAVLHGPKDLRMEDRPIWPPRHNEAQVRVMATGLCGSDLHYYLHGRNGDFQLQHSLVLGHEAGGIVTAVGSGVTHLRVGQRVAIEAGVMCRNCSYCKEGRYNLCKEMRFCSSAKTHPHLDGTLQERMNHPAHVLHPLPDSCSFEHAALAEPLSVLLHASRRAGLTDKPNQTVLVYGVGAIGMLACALSKSLGASRVVAVDINAARLAFAQSSGFADATYLLPTPPPPPAGEPRKPVDPEEQLRRASTAAASTLTHFSAPDGFDVVFECTGAPPCIQQSISTARVGGKVMLVGMGTRALHFPLAAAATREVDVLGSFRYANTYPEALAMLSEGRLEGVERLITHRFGLESAREAFECLAKGEDAEGRMVVKVIVGPEA